MNTFAKKRAARTSGSLAFQLSPVAAGCAVFIAVMGGNVYAQDTVVAQPASTEPVTADDGKTVVTPGLATVRVTGIRRGIEAAISVKKNNDSIVEAISAEDIGKLPDSSIAESIARLPGVTAQRTGGRASAVSIRGMSPDFSTALLNGREQVSTGDSRGVEFDQYPSELLGGVVIYKTPDGALVGQGLSGTVDMQTVRPLDFAKRTVAVNYRREKAGLGMESQGDGNRVSVSYIDQFANRTIGLALGFARLDGTSGQTTRFESWGNGEAQFNGATVKVPYNGFNAWTDQSTQTRDGAMAVVQFRPSRDFSSTIDLFYSKYDRNTMTHGLQMPLNDSWVSPTSPYDRPGALTSAVISGGSATSGTFNNVRAVVRNDAVKTKDESKSLGWNNRLKLNEDWTATVDLSYNTAERNGSNIEAYAGSAAYDNVSFTAGSRAFGVGLNYASPDVVRLTDVQGWGGSDIQAGYAKEPHVYDKIKAVRFDVQRDLPEGWFFSKLTTGVNLSDRSKTREFTEALLSIKGGTGPFASAPFPAGSGSAVAGDTGIPVLTFDPVANSGLYNFNRKDHPDIWNKDWVVNEKVTTAFAKLNIDSQIGSLPLRGAAGLQVVRTKQDSTAYAVDQKGGTGDTSRPVGTFTDGTTYTDVLPSLNLIADLGNQQSVRLAAAKIMARPTMNDMRASNKFGYDASKGIFTGDGGNAKVEPFRAKGLDISYERYWDTKAYVSLAAFYKKLDTYIVTAGRDYDFTPVLLPSTIKAPSNLGTFTQPYNGTGGNIKGVEFAVSVPFNLVTRYLDGFGAVVNGSQNSSKVAIPDTSDGGSGTMGLPGMSKRVGSVTVYYEKAGFSARLAQRYRSDFIGEMTTFAGDRQATYIAAEKIADLQLGYEFETGMLKGLSFLVQMNNLTNAEFVRYRKTKDNVIEQTKYGRTVLFGVNYKL